MFFFFLFGHCRRHGLSERQRQGGAVVRARLTALLAAWPLCRKGQETVASAWCSTIMSLTSTRRENDEARVFETAK